MTLKVIFDLINYIVGKNQSGNTMTISNLNDLIPLADSEILNTELDKLVQSELTPISGELLSTSPLRVFGKDEQIYVTSAIPTDYVRWASLGALYGGSWRDIDVVGDREFNQRRGNVLYHPEIKPFCRITKTQFYFIPNDIGVSGNISTNIITLTYIRKPVPAYYDYCQDSATLLNVYMPVGSYVTQVGNVQVLYDKDDNVINGDVTGGNMTYLPYTSTSVELEWEDRIHEEFIIHILSKVGINLDKTQVTQYAEMLKKQ